MDRAVILARGLGTRMREGDATADLDASQEAVAATGVKALIPIDRPFLDYVLSDLAAAERWVGDEPFLMINSDSYYPASALAVLRNLDGPGVAVFGWDSMLARGNVSEERLLKFSVVESGADGLLERIVEKPDRAELKTFTGPWGIGMNCWRFDQRIFAACDAIEPSARGELELPDAVAVARSAGVSFAILHIEEAVLDMSSRADVASVKELLAGREVRL